MKNGHDFASMTWLNEPQSWETANDKLTMAVTPRSDYWRISHYGFTKDDGPFLYAPVGGEFETKLKITGDYTARYDQAGLMIRIDHEHWLKAGIEYVDGKYNISTVVTHHTSDWSVITLDHPLESIWIKAVRCRDAVELFYSFDDKEYIMMRICWMQEDCPVMVGPYAACPEGEGFDARFEHFCIKPLPKKDNEQE
ncbi:MAG: DUF1349 domain-containing protein [Prevotella sp.]|nr:DUF1349 domain-containing protein [Prevotella sp.]